MYVFFCTTKLEQEDLMLSVGLINTILVVTCIIGIICVGWAIRSVATPPLESFADDVYNEEEVYCHVPTNMLDEVVVFDKLRKTNDSYVCTLTGSINCSKQNTVLVDDTVVQSVYDYENACYIAFKRDLSAASLTQYGDRLGFQARIMNTRTGVVTIPLASPPMATLSNGPKAAPPKASPPSASPPNASLATLLAPPPEASQSDDPSTGDPPQAAPPQAAPPQASPPVAAPPVSALLETVTIPSNDSDGKSGKGNNADVCVADPPAAATPPAASIQYPVPDQPSFNLQINNNTSSGESAQPVMHPPPPMYPPPMYPPMMPPYMPPHPPCDDCDDSDDCDDCDDCLGVYDDIGSPFFI
jgi:hypothetical protein